MRNYPQVQVVTTRLVAYLLNDNSVTAHATVAHYLEPSTGIGPGSWHHMDWFLDL